jgi:hypothetical protein
MATARANTSLAGTDVKTNRRVTKREFKNLSSLGNSAFPMNMMK